ncbi:Ig-like domain-containing protein [Spirosoma luteum]|uniref:Ig-like domain-containing protein n=1 Tax=Spirosoma luteum TaxID=431553 RepID=UPI0003771D35|nr:Ig-like domain-containing protein [Spirosoma luteum]
MKRFLRVTIWGCLLLTGWAGFAQQSTNAVDFLLTYEASSTLYTAWVVPRYNVPNANNTGQVEKGGTAQFTIKVPATFTISAITDAVGVWEKTPLRLGPGNLGQDWSGSGLDPAVNYYVIGKSPGEATYGSFLSGTPVRLFTFRGNGCVGPLAVLEPGNPFIAEADQRYSLNVANSFYSLSGTPAGGNQTPAEQFKTVTGNPAQCASLVANPDALTLTAGVSTTVSVLANDFTNGQPASTTNVTITLTTPPATGTATVNANGTIGFIPAAGFTGPVSFTYTICDIAQPSVCASAAVSLTVNPVPAVLTANPDALTLTAGVTTTIPVLANDTRNGQPASSTNVTVTLTTLPATGTATVNANGTISFIPAAGFTGPVSFTYTICDIAQTSVCTSAAVSLTVNPVPAVLTANPDALTLTAGVAATIPVLVNDFNNGQPASITNVTVTLTTPPATGTATVNANGTISFIPAAGFTGPVSFTYTICDIAQTSVCTSAAVSLTVNPVPAVLTANPDALTLTAGVTTTIPVLVNDFNNGQPANSTNVTVTLTTPPATGTATVNANGTIGFIPAAGFTGPVSFTYTICDLIQTSVCASAAVNLTVNPVPAVLTANPDALTLTAGVTTTIPVLVNDFNNGQPASTTNVTVTLTTPPATGTATVNANGTINFIPAAGFTGPVSFTYTICDIAQPLVCASASISLTVQAVPNQSADLLITKKVSQSGSVVGDVVSFTITVQNMGPGSAVGVIVTDTLLRNSTVQLQGTSTPSKGSFNSATGLWTVGDLTANETVTFVLSVRLLSEGVLVNVASVTATGSQDPNETNNLASACTSVPYVLCSGESLTVSVPREYLNVQWYRNGGSAPVFTGNTVTIDLPGTYTVSSSNGSCPIAGCCPIVVQQGACCPPDACVPFVIKKTKSRI